MKKSKLCRILRTFPPDEQERFRAFVASPYHSGKSELTQLLATLLQYWPAFEINKKTVFAHAFPDSAYNDKQFRYLTSDLNKLAEQFLAIQTYQQQPVRHDLDTLLAFAERSLDKEYAHIHRRIKQSFDQRSERDVSYYDDQHRLATVEQRHFELQRQRTFDKSLQKASDYLDHYYFLQKLKYSCGMLDRQQVIKGNYELNLTEALIQHVELQDFFGDQVIFYYYNVLLALREENKEEHFFRLRALLMTPAKAVPFAELRDLYFFAINYCLRKIRQGKTPFVREALNLYRQGIERKLLLDQGNLSPWTFTNVVKLALRLKEYDWIKRFIRDMVHLLPEAFQSDALHYNLAETYYYTQEYEEALDHLNQVRLSDLNYHLGSRVLLAKIYYEEGSEEPLLSLIAAFTIFLKRNKKLSNTIKMTYLNFCTILFQILKRRPGKWDDIAERIEKTALLTDRAWLQQVLDKER